MTPPAAPSCHHCGKKLGVMSFSCRCGEAFCPKHRLPEAHSCGFDYKELGKASIRVNNPRVAPPKVAEV